MMQHTDVFVLVSEMVKLRVTLLNNYAHIEFSFAILYICMR